MKLRQYAVFQFETYYPEGGWTDFSGSFDSLEEAKKSLNPDKGRRYQIVNLNDGEIVRGKLEFKDID